MLCVSYTGAARLLDCSTRTIQYLVSDGKLKSIPFGKRGRRIAMAELQRYVDSLGVGA